MARHHWCAQPGGQNGNQLEAGRCEGHAAAGRLGKKAFNHRLMLVGIGRMFVVVRFVAVAGVLMLVTGCRVWTVAVVLLGELGNPATIAEITAMQAEQLGCRQSQQDAGGQQALAETHHKYNF